MGAYPYRAEHDVAGRPLRSLSTGRDLGGGKFGLSEALRALSHGLWQQLLDKEAGGAKAELLLQLLAREQDHIRT